ncbi:glutamyl-tRNA synthetase [Ascodesmis nigricans]|uniref:glutamate--tRNA ligase n=1 Tax=Ascodesmis nigricans TaxID=341454 RepID=A0A4S2N5J0_9PEZI|nr:glutamyl-tRNA synthetase [Ascodesmis nigricans]
MASFNIHVASKALQADIYPVLIAANVVNTEDFEANPVAIVYKDVDQLDKSKAESTVGIQFEGEDISYGTNDVLHKLAEHFPTLLRGPKPVLVDEWISFGLTRLGGKDFKATSAALEELNNHLSLRSVLVGHRFTIADTTVWGALNANGQAISAIRRNHLPNLVRWFKYIASIDRIGSVVENFKAELNNKKKVKSKESNFEIGLLDTDKGVVTRFPPEPSGYLHIGHAKAALLNQYFAEQYKGKLIIRFDDTNPTKEKQEFQDSILEDLKLLGIHGDQVTYTSDHFDHLYQEAIRIIKLGKAYCDDTIQEKMRAERMDGIASARRDRTVEENLRIFEEMAKASEEGLKNCLRAKISVDDPNKAMRDPVIYRCNPEPHHRTGSKYKIYPTYDFACPLVDSFEGVTHALRTIEYRDRNPQYWWMLEALGLRKVHVWDFARLNFIKTVLSKRKLTWFVNEGIVHGWDDPRFPTVRGIRRRGMTIEALKQFIISQGPSKNVVNLDWTIIWAFNKKVIDPISPRFTALLKDKLVTVTIEGAPTPAVCENKPKHAKNADVGLKKVYFGSPVFLEHVDAAALADNEEVTLMNWGNAIVTSITRDDKTVTGVTMKLNLAGDVKSTKKKLTWLAKDQKLVNVKLMDFGDLITKDKLEEGDDVALYANKDSEFTEEAVADENIWDVKVDDIVQFERKGYYRCDVPAEGDKPAVFFNIPTGKK